MFVNELEIYLVPTGGITFETGAEKPPSNAAKPNRIQAESVARARARQCAGNPQLPRCLARRGRTDSAFVRNMPIVWH